MSAHRTTARAAKRFVLEVVGWLLVVAGLAALVLPGPGMLMLFSGLAVLSGQYRWARRMLRPVKIQALLGAAEGVETIPRIMASTFGALCLMAAGVVWIVQPTQPSWWPLGAWSWLPGGITVGITLIGSSLAALALLVYSVRRFHGRPDEAEEVRAMKRARTRASRQLRQRRREAHAHHRTSA